MMKGKKQTQKTKKNIHVLIFSRLVIININKGIAW